MPDKRLGQYAKYLSDYADSVLSMAFEYDANNNLIFMGRAEAGTAKSDSHWQIKKFFYDVNNNLLDVKWVDGNGNFSFIWDDRAGFEYK